MKYKYIGAVLLACLILGLCISPVAASNNFGSGTAFLHQGQTHIYTVTTDSSSQSQIIMTPPSGANFDLFAMQRDPRLMCPSASEVMQFATFSSRNGIGLQESITLSQGTWCVVVFAQSGSGTYRIFENRVPLPIPTVPIVTPTIPPASPGLFREDIQFGNAVHGQSTVYVYQIGGGRTAIEWFAQPTNCNAFQPPIVMSNPASISSMRQILPACNLNLDMYVYMNCDPRFSRCTALYADTSLGSGAYVGIPFPVVGAKYYVQVHAKQGSGPFRVIARSYTDNDTPIVMMSSGELFTAMNVASPT